MEKKWKIFLAYLVGWVSGLIILLIEQEDKEVKYHAAQSLVIFLTITFISIVFSMMFFLLPFIPLLFNLVGFIIWIYFLVSVLMDKYPKISLVEPLVNKIVK